MAIQEKAFYHIREITADFIRLLRTSEKFTVVCWRCHWTCVLIKCTFFHVVFNGIQINWLVDLSDSFMWCSHLKHANLCLCHTNRPPKSIEIFYSYPTEHHVLTKCFFIPLAFYAEGYIVFAFLFVHSFVHPSHLGLQRYTELSSIHDMGSGKLAFRITSCIFARFANFLEPVIVLKIGKFADKIFLCFKQFLAAIISGEMYVASARCVSLFLRFGTQ